MSHPLKQPLAWLYQTMTQSSPRYRWFWLGVSLLFAVYYGWLTLQQAFAGTYVVQDDARQHVFWMQRFIDPDLFPNDLIADYFQGVAPLGYAGLYRLAATVGLPPLLFSKILPPILGLLTAWLVYEISWTLLPVPLASFIASVSFSQSVWYSSEHGSATPRAFLYPLMLAFIYFLMRQKPWLYLGSLILLALFYPQIALVCLGVLAIRLLDWKNRRLSFTSNRVIYIQFTLGFCAVAGILLYAQGQADFGPVISRAEAITMREFQPGGRNAFFFDGLYFWLHDRGGFLHRRGFTPAMIIAGAVLPLLLWMPIRSRWRSQINSQVWVLFQLLLASLGLFILAHLVLFELHLPSRYSSHSLRAILGVACGVSWVIILDDLSTLISAIRQHQHGQSAAQQPNYRSFLKQAVFVSLSSLLIVFIVIYPSTFFERFPRVGYYDFSDSARLYEYFAAQPKATLVASLSGQAGNIPMFSGRAVLVSGEHALAYHTGYYDEFRDRTEALLEAQYTTEPTLVAQFISTYGVDAWLIDNGAFQAPYVTENRWLRQYESAVDNVVQQLAMGPPVLQQAVPLCTATSTEAWTVLDANCVNDFASNLSDR
ncbi:MAG: hypothetical protein AAGD09_08080 [Cyanobacteria bacterium P01_F01_bin.56]